MVGPPIILGAHKGLSLARSVAFTIAPAITMVAGLYVLAPWLRTEGLSPYASLMVGFSLPFASLLIAALLAYRLERRPITLPAMRARFRLQKLDRAKWIWAAALFVLSLGSYLLIKNLSAGLVTGGTIPLPEGIMPGLDPQSEYSIQELVGSNIRGNWPLLGLVLFELLCNIWGEELWWRGYILPRQEKTHGSYAWLIHGLFWTLFHAFKYWEILALLPTCLAFAYVAQRTRSTWPCLIAHTCLNGLEVIGILFLVLGVIEA